MTQLAAAVDADDEVWTLDALPPSPYVQVGDELIEIRSRYPSRIYQPTQQPLPPKIRVRRGTAGTTAASHNNGSTLTPIYGAGTSGGGLIVDNQSDPPAEVTTLIVPGATITGDEATLPGATEVQILSRTTELTNAAIINIPTLVIPTELVPAPGAGKVIHYLGGFLVCDTTGGIYEYNPAGAAEAYIALRMGTYEVSVRITDSDDASVLGNLLGYEEPYGVSLPPRGAIATTAVSDAVTTFIRAADGSPTANLENEALVLGGKNGNGSGTVDDAFTGGHLNNRMSVTVIYTIVDLPA